MSIVYRALDLPAGPDALNGLSLAGPIPAKTLNAAERAKGALLRTLFFAEDDQGGIATLLGYHRPHTSQMKLTALDGTSKLYDGLIAFAAQTVHDAGLAIKTELDALAPAKFAAAEARARGEHYRQTTDFTCGAVATLDALRRLELRGPIVRDDEIALWREATMFVACGPYGLALAADRRGRRPTVYVSQSGCALDPHERAVGILDAALARDVQLAFEREAHASGIDVRVGPFGVSDIASALDAGHAVIVLVDETHWHAELCPHWVTVVRHESDRFFIDDPWCDLEFGESAIDAYELAVDADDLELVSSYEGIRSMLVF